MPSFLTRLPAARLLVLRLLVVVPLLGTLALAQPLDISTIWPEYRREHVEAGSYGGSLRVPLPYFEPFESLNIIQDLTASSLLLALYPRLMAFNPMRGESACMSCTSYEVSDDGLEVTFTLREGVEWSDGTSVTAADFVITAAIVADPQAQTNFMRLVRVGEGKITYTAKDDQTLVMHLPEPVPEATWKSLAGMPALPAHIFRPAYEEGGLTAVEELYPLGSSGIVSAGPWRFGGYNDQGGLVLLENRNGNWVTDAYGNELPYLDEVRLFGPGDRNESELMLAGEAEIAIDLTDKNLVDDLRVGGWAVVPVNHQSSVMDYVIPNFVHPNPRLRQLMKAREFRRALSMLIDREHYVEDLYGPLAEPSYNWNDREGYVDLPYPVFEHDREVARGLLERLGLRRDPDRSACPGGCYVFADGTPLRLELMHFDRPQQNAGAALVAKEFTAAGLETEDLPLPVDDAVDRVYFRSTENFREFDLYFEQRPSAIDGKEFYRQVFDVASDFHYWGMGPEVGEPPPALLPWEVRLSELASIIESDAPLSQRVAAAAEGTVIFAEELPMIPIAVHHRFQAYAGNLRNTFDQVSEDYLEPYIQGPLLQLLYFE